MGLTALRVVTRIGALVTQFMIDVGLFQLPVPYSCQILVVTQWKPVVYRSFVERREISLLSYICGKAENDAEVSSAPQQLGKENCWRLNASLRGRTQFWSVEGTVRSQQRGRSPVEGSQGPRFGGRSFS
jgi:hypothetical protein